MRIMDEKHVITNGPRYLGKQPPGTKQWVTANEEDAQIYKSYQAAINVLKVLNRSLLGQFGKVKPYAMKVTTNDSKIESRTMKTAISDKTPSQKNTEPEKKQVTDKQAMLNATLEKEGLDGLCDRVESTYDMLVYGKEALDCLTKKLGEIEGMRVDFYHLFEFHDLPMHVRDEVDALFDATLKERRKIKTAIKQVSVLLETSDMSKLPPRSVPAYTPRQLHGLFESLKQYRKPTKCGEINTGGHRSDPIILEGPGFVEPLAFDKLRKKSDMKLLDMLTWLYDRGSSQNGK